MRKWDTMTFELSPGAEVTIEGQRYVVEEVSAFHEVDFRLDLARLVGATPAHERWLLGVQSEPHLMVLTRLQQDWLTPLQSGLAHGGEIFTLVTKGSAHRVRRTRGGGRGKGRLDYALFRANSGRVILTITQNEEIDAWIGVTAPRGAVGLPGQAA